MRVRRINSGAAAGCRRKTDAVQQTGYMEKAASERIKNSGDPEGFPENRREHMHDRLTQSDIDKMQEEIDHRKLVVRKAAIEAVKEARAQGDLSENFEYYAAKREKNLNESRIRYLETMIKTAILVEDTSKEDEVGLNKRVTILVEDEEETEEYKIVTTVRGNSLNGLITAESPLGSALMGHKVGDTVYVKVNDRVGYNVEIKAIENTGEEETDTLRKF